MYCILCLCLYVCTSVRVSTSTVAFFVCSCTSAVGLLLIIKNFDLTHSLSDHFTMFSKKLFLYVTCSLPLNIFFYIDQINFLNEFDRQTVIPRARLVFPTGNRLSDWCTS